MKPNRMQKEALESALQVYQSEVYCWGLDEGMRAMCRLLGVPKDQVGAYVEEACNILAEEGKL